MQSQRDGELRLPQCPLLQTTFSLSYEFMCSTMSELEIAHWFIVMLVLEGLNIIVSTIVLSLCNIATSVVSRGALDWEISRA